ncbi:MAG: hypothetical protein GOV02_03180 [Candidatus Aenigmarchaeota archaeon]|nr:hypothetical protein [Candidatus Aenigmarchaeota archaeon]
MLYLNPNKEKTLTFEVQLSGASSSEITGYVRFIVEGVEIGFPAIIKEDEIQAVISPLKNFLKNPLKNGTIFEANLELYTEEQEYFNAWKGEIEVKMPVMIEAKLNEEEKVSGVSVKAKMVAPKEKPSQGKVITETKISKKEQLKTKLRNLTEEDIYNYMARAGTKNKQIQEIVLSEARKKAESGDLLKVFKEVVNALKKPKKR